MRQMTLKLYPEYQRPVVKLEQFHNPKAMIDTGAVYPVWMSGEERLQRLGAIKKKDSVPDDESISRRLTIKDKNGRLYVLCSSAE